MEPRDDTSGGRIRAGKRIATKDLCITIHKYNWSEYMRAEVKMPLYVYGDVSVDNYEYFGKFSEAYKKLFATLKPPPPGMSDEAPHRIVARALGGSYLLARFASTALSLWRSKNPFQHPDKQGEWFERLEKLEPWATERHELHRLNSDITKSPERFEGLLRLHYRLKRSPHDKCFRVEIGGMEGYTVPAVYRPGKYLNSQKLYEEDGRHGIPVDGAPTDSKNHVMLFNDGGLKHATDTDAWLDDEIEKYGAESIWAVIKSRDPSTARNERAFSRFLTKLNKRMPERTIVCLNADDLRALGVEIGRSLSWEKSLKDLESNIRAGKVLKDQLPAYLVVTFDYDAVAYLKIRKSRNGATIEKGAIVFSKNASEGEFAARVDGKMPGAQSLFVSVFSALLYEWHKDFAKKTPAEPPFEMLVGYGLLAKRRMLESGFASLDPVPGPPKKWVAGQDHWLHPKVYYQTAVFALQELRQKDEDKTTIRPDGFKESETERPSFRSPLKGNEGLLRDVQLADLLEGSQLEGLLKKWREDQLEALKLKASQLGVQLAEAQLEAHLKDAQSEDQLKAVQLKVSELAAQLAQAQLEALLKDAQSEDPLKDSQLRKDLAGRDLVIFQFESDFFKGSIEIFQYLATKSKFDDNRFIKYVQEDDASLPVCTMGKMKSISREEIEGLRTIRRLAKNYLESVGPNEKPIGIAVFGPPGTGKSFAVKTVFDTLPKKDKDLIEDAFLECNLSGLERPEDIAEFFQFARDKRLRGKVPVLFFDEFDCTVGDEPYFWLKHFLAPLQDGEFITGHTKRPIGKSIFVFAGGTKRNYREFEDEVEPDFSKVAKGKSGARARIARKKATDGKKPVIKGRDFLSRLQAHLDIMALDPDEKELNKRKGKARDSYAFPYTMRKAILLRGALTQWAPQIFDSRKRASMDDELIGRFLTKWRYKHGIRSMEAIIRMSALSDGVRFSKSCLPPDEQLFMHIHEHSYRAR
jgi:hypothetical protein